MKDPRGAVRLVEVGPRDGLQNIRDHVPTSLKIELIRKLHRTGLRAIELTSVVSPRAVPQLADCRDVLRNDGIRHLLDQPLRLPVLVPNLKGLEVAIEHGAQEVAVFVSASEGFSRANINCSVRQGIERARAVAHRAAQHGLAVRGYVSCIFADPFDGPTSPSAVLHCVRELLDMGCYEVSLGDTLGTGAPDTVRSLVTYLVDSHVPVDRLAGHFHDTYGRAVANVWEAYRCGLRVFDSSIGGLGGCPFAPGAEGNVATEDLVYMFHSEGIETGVNILHLLRTGVWISQALSRPYATRAGRALALKHKLLPPAVHTTVQPVIHPTTKWSPVGKASNYDRLLVYRSGSNLKVVLNRPKKGNALTPNMIVDLVNLIEKCNKEPSISRIIMSAKGRFFCMGVDSPGPKSPLDQLTRLFKVIEHSPKTTIACINGPAFGAGVGLALSCDIRLSVKTAAFTVDQVGLSGGFESKPADHPVTAAELKSLGVIAEVADDVDELQDCLNKLLMRLRTSPSTASRISARLIRLIWAHIGRDGREAGVDQVNEFRSESNEMRVAIGCAQ
ncbi:aldolase [Aspergillus steynii IBT 23096]|uniref:hydroxymethylglutaryl-CoA lyase n=1 Tax=Aspergillus steynii IBT 23096 TaxID=1392250 RepID=A0A2I2G9V4_9EURO|nr:aldolase [Aspergillus steynii IBT 23096]PLB49654.1 aldolase [Aspergillus steynii IBT 23096]